MTVEAAIVFKRICVLCLMAFIAYHLKMFILELKGCFTVIEAGSILY